MLICFYNTIPIILSCTFRIIYKIISSPSGGTPRVDGGRAVDALDSRREFWLGHGVMVGRSKRPAQTLLRLLILDSLGNQSISETISLIPDLDLNPASRIA